MAHGGYGKRRVAGRKPAAGNRRSGVDNKNIKKPKSIKNQMRSFERCLRKQDLPPDKREALEKKVQALKKQQEDQNLEAIKHKIFLRDKKIKFFERRKIERRLRRVEKMQRASIGQPQEAELAEQLSKLKEDLEYVKFFPEDEKYVPLFMGGDDTGIVDRRNRLRKQIKDNRVAAAANGKDMEETGSEDDGPLDLSGDDFFLTGSSSDEAEADDEWTDRSTKEQASSASGKAASEMSSDERNQRQVSARALMPPPRPSSKSYSGSMRPNSRFAASSSKRQSLHGGVVSTSSNTSNSVSEPSLRNGGSSDSRGGQKSNLSSNSDAHKPRRKRRPKKKKQQA